ncbi:DinB family protein [Flavitalea sp. BT771]|uniref:DinB family protein n=1 Tax=Flavitalea sp. BT771 TaxID=3063329 RepID=UPI0026E1AE19|nr:DinB family protein [Flavitalea sp. BT771]MDO6429021.1 DinB family protein [Flavitalea sp. BT771]MDV6218851.1 DinB family protein [Flavitalea sp. BT771]
MTPVDKDHLLDTLEAHVDLHIRMAVAVFQNMPEALLLRPAADGGWSVAQCLEHLNQYGNYYLPFIRQRLHRSLHDQVEGGKFKSSFIGAYFTRLMDPDKGKKKMKAFSGYVPAAELDAHAVVAEFIRQQELLLLCLQLSRKVDLNKIRIPVSIFKWIRLKLGDVFQFLIAHNERHLRQAKRNCPAD